MAAFLFFSARCGKLPACMPHDLQDTIALLSRTPAALDALLRGLPPLWTRTNEGENTWNALDIVAHLIHGEHTDWIPRANRILQHGESLPFDPFDRLGYPAGEKSLEQLLDEFHVARNQSLAELNSLRITPEQLALRGRHPALGTVTLSELLATWAAHDLSHLHQLARVMAHQYRPFIGPWPPYLGVMQCNGRSS